MVIQHMFNICLEEKNGVNVVFNPKNASVHVLEVDNGYEAALAQCMDSVLPRIKERIEGYGHACSELRWFFYDGHGKVTFAEGDKEQEVGLHHPELHPAFVSKVKLRLAVSNHQH